jgi:hypothetical protein
MLTAGSGSGVGSPSGSPVSDFSRWSKILSSATHRTRMAPLAWVTAWSAPAGTPGKSRSVGGPPGVVCIHSRPGPVAPRYHKTGLAVPPSSLNACTSNPSSMVPTTCQG